MKDGSVPICVWCGSTFTPRRGSGSPQRFCRTKCRRAFDLAARCWVRQALECGRVTVPELQNAPITARALLLSAVPALPVQSAALRGSRASDSLTGPSDLVASLAGHTHVNPHRRLRSETVRITLRISEGVHVLDVSLAYDANGVLREVAFVGRGKVGHGLDLMLHNLGIQLSRAIQGRDPDTGRPAAEPLSGGFSDASVPR